MKNRIIFCFIILLTLFLSFSIISASDNETCDNLTAIVNESGDVISLDNLNKSSTEFQAENKTSFVDYCDNFSVKLSSNGVGLQGKSVLFTLDNVTYNKTTDLNGQANINFKLKTGVYKVTYSFMGDENYAPSNGTSILTIKSDVFTSLKLVKKGVFREGLKTIFQVKLADIYGIGLSSKKITIKVGSKTYNVKTNSKGIATVYLKLKKGSHTIKFSFSGLDNYLSCSNNIKINVKERLSKGNGYWVNMWSMKKVNLKKNNKKGTKHIFLLHSSISKYGKKYTIKWIKKAHKYGMKVHIWISVFYKYGKFIKPCSKKGKFNYAHMNKVIKQVKHYAGFKCVDGIHFDYARFPGTAYKYKHGVKAVNYFIKKASNTVRKVNPEVIVSAAVMPEPTSMKHYYGQDISIMSKYLDVIIPMIYKGNYHAGTKWIKKTTKQFVKMSKGAKIWSGLQSYKSDWNIKKLSYKSLFKDAKAAKKGGASGVVLFRWGLSPLLNFKKL